MRYLYTFSGIMVLLLLVSTGCTKTPLYSPGMVATIDTLPFSATGASQVYCDSGSNSATTLTITGATTIFIPGTSVTPIIKLYVPFAVGSYSINNNCYATIYTLRTGKSGTKADNGIIVVQGIVNGRIVGTFSFNCEDGEKVTKGQFYCFLPK